MATIQENAPVKVFFKTTGLDNKPFEVSQSAKVVKHEKRGGWILLRFKSSATEYQYRVRWNKAFGHFNNDLDSKIYVQITPVEILQII